MFSPIWQNPNIIPETPERETSPEIGEPDMEWNLQDLEDWQRGRRLTVAFRIARRYPTAYNQERLSRVIKEQMKRKRGKH